jgi:hypothetical protein
VTGRLNLFKVNDQVADVEAETPNERSQGPVLASCRVTSPSHERQDTWAYLVEMRRPGWTLPIVAWWLEDWLTAVEP